MGAAVMMSATPIIIVAGPSALVTAMTRKTTVVTLHVKATVVRIFSGRAIMTVLLGSAVCHLSRSYSRQELP
jgi:hypothetical protein